jgi:transposase-like protein
VISMAVLIEVGVCPMGEREVVDVDVAAAEDHESWLQFLRRSPPEAARPRHLT